MYCCSFELAKLSRNDAAGSSFIPLPWSRLQAELCLAAVLHVHDAAEKGDIAVHRSVTYEFMERVASLGDAQSQ